MTAFTFRPAVRESVGLIIGLVGPSGGGKTFTALRLAKGIAGDKPFAVIDTEASRAKHYADQFKFDHGDLRPPFRPDAYADAIKAADAAGYPAIVVDSFSHEHAGEGGLLDWHEEEFQRMGGNDKVKMTAWIKPKMAHRKMLGRLLQVRAHLILCFRAEEKIEIIKNAQGKTEIVPKTTLAGFSGWIPICEKNLPYELTASFMLMPDKPGYPQPIKLEAQHRILFPLDKAITEESGAKLAAWARGGASAVDTQRAKPASSSQASLGPVDSGHATAADAPSVGLPGVDVDDEAQALAKQITALRDTFEKPMSDEIWRKLCKGAVGTAELELADVSSLSDFKKLLNSVIAKDEGAIRAANDLVRKQAAA